MKRERIRDRKERIRMWGLVEYKMTQNVISFANN